MAATVAMPSERLALGELNPFSYNKFTKAELANTIENAGFANSFNIPSTKFEFSSTIKRTFDLYEDEDQENADPAALSGSGKRVRGSDGEAVKGHHGPKFNLSTVQEPKISESTKIARITLGVKPRASASTRSTGLASRRRLGSKRVVQPKLDPKFGKAAVGDAHPTTNSVNGNLKSTIKTSEPSANDRVSALRQGRMGRKAQHFTIYEDTPFDEMANQMQHSAYTLDISDDEKPGKITDDSDKENVPPAGAPASALRPVGRVDMMTEDIRCPLGQLEATEYYADGCDANSVIIAPQDPLPRRELLDVEFGSIDGELLGDYKAKSTDMNESVAGEVIDIACDNVAFRIISPNTVFTTPHHIYSTLQAQPKDLELYQTLSTASVMQDPLHGKQKIPDCSKPFSQPPPKPLLGRSVTSAFDSAVIPATPHMLRRQLQQDLDRPKHTFTTHFARSASVHSPLLI
ncbi:MAG: hypothetical protein Q9228_003178 [Teloschistes exilis]